VHDDDGHVARLRVDREPEADELDHRDQQREIPLAGTS